MHPIHILLQIIDVHMYVYVPVYMYLYVFIFYIIVVFQLLDDVNIFNQKACLTYPSSICNPCILHHLTLITS